jgi:hypothetical protein
VIKGNNQIANNVTMEFKNVNPNDDKDVASNLININFFFF